MVRTFGWVVLCLFLFLCVIAGAGFYLQWFSFSASNTSTQKSDVHLSVNKDKIQEDVNAVKAGAKHGAEEVKKEFDSLLGDTTIAGTIEQMETARQELTIVDAQKKDVTIKVDGTTKIKIGDKDGSFSDLQTGDPVSVVYEAKKDGNVAKTITVTKKV